MVGTVDAGRRLRRAGRPHDARPEAAAVPRRSPHRRHGRAARRHGHRGVRRGGPAARARAGTWSAVEDVDFLAPVKFYRDEPRTLTIRATVRRDGADLVAGCALEAERTLPGRTSRSARRTSPGSVRLAANAAGAGARRRRSRRQPKRSASERVYDLYFHGPAYQVVGASWRHDGGNAARFADDLPDNHVPMAAPTSSVRAWSSCASRRPVCGRRPATAGWRCRGTSTRCACCATRRRSAGRCTRSRTRTVITSTARCATPTATWC